ncbi:MAG: hypothetical protein LBU85_08915 [Treponema sp.]|jgi:hypothetical protein|nr:hypothetical protein [Treponema sp.]
MGKTKDDIGEPFPVIVPGREKPISSKDVTKYVNSELIHYYNLYANIKLFGNPLQCSWMDLPLWVIQLVRIFDNAVEEMKLHFEREAIKLSRGFR